MARTLANVGESHLQELIGIVSGVTNVLWKEISVRREAHEERGAGAEMSYWNQAMAGFVEAIRSLNRTAIVTVFDQPYMESDRDRLVPLAEKTVALLTADGFKATAIRDQAYNAALGTYSYTLRIGLSW